MNYPCVARYAIPMILFENNFQWGERVKPTILNRMLIFDLFFFCLQYSSHSSPEKGVSRVSLSSHSIHFFAKNIPMDCESFNVFRKIERQIPL